MKISPTLLKDLSSQLKGPIIMVCGTNGKTTTNNLIYSLMNAKGKSVVCNNVGANMLPGVASAFINMSSLFGKLKADCASIECDEASLRRVVPHVSPTMIVVTNMFRDQLDRYGEIEMTLGYLNEAIEKVPDVTLVLNGDDPVTMQLAKGRKFVTYGVDENCNVSVRESKEGKFCLCCGRELSYNYYHYSQLGDYYCKNCGFKRPRLDYFAKNINMDDGIKFDINGKIETTLSVNYRGFYNIYNILASVCVLCECKESYVGINSVFDEYKPQIGRMEAFCIGGKTTVLNLAKNPAGFNQAIATVLTDKRSKDILIAINDMPSDGKDISWIWDVDFERLAEGNVNKIYVSGMRKHDLAVRLKYGGFKNVSVVGSERDDLKKIISDDGEICYMLVNYTVLFATQANLKALSTLSEGGEIK
ncbi:MAG: DUF1727 domain-containing protein [Clostridia bacterium]|nr:DUF1727 domain-containing protein [Clostridia bacterium]